MIEDLFETQFAWKIKRKKGGAGGGGGKVGVGGGGGGGGRNAKTTRVSLITSCLHMCIQN